MNSARPRPAAVIAVLLAALLAVGCSSPATDAGTENVVGTAWRWWLDDATGLRIEFVDDNTVRLSHLWQGEWSAFDESGTWSRDGNAITVDSEGDPLDLVIDGVHMTSVGDGAGYVWTKESEPDPSVLQGTTWVCPVAGGRDWRIVFVDATAAEVAILADGEWSRDGSGTWTHDGDRIILTGGGEDHWMHFDGERIWEPRNASFCVYTRQ